MRAADVLSTRRSDSSHARREGAAHGEMRAPHEEQRVGGAVVHELVVLDAEQVVERPQPGVSPPTR